MKSLKASNEFQIGSHNIKNLYNFGQFDNVSFEKRSLGSFRKLERSMLDSEIESQLTPGTCELGDVLAFLDNAPQECKDGYANLFYLSGCVVYVHWYSGDSGWRVCAWQRGGDDWSADNRVFSPATGSLKALGSGSSDALSLESLDARLRKLEERNPASVLGSMRTKKKSKSSKKNGKKGGRPTRKS